MTVEEIEEEDSEEQCPVKNSLWTALRRNTNWKCLILTSLMCGCLAAILWCRLTEITKHILNFSNYPIASQKRASPCDDGYIYIPIAFVVTLYMVYLVECWHCTTRIELKYKTDVASVYDRVHQMKTAQPIVWWKAICYHYLRRSRQVTRYRNGNAYTSTQIYYERINSHSSSASFIFAHCGVKDISKKLVNLEKFPATKIRFSKGFAFANIEAAAEFEDQRARFFQENERRDDYMEMREGLDLTNVNFKEYLMTFADPERSPWYISHLVFWIASFLLVSWPLRLLIESRTAYVHYQVTKVFGTNYVTSTPLTPNNNNLSDGNYAAITPSSTDLEWHIGSNLGLVPSYSEALLMDSALVDNENHHPGAPPVAEGAPGQPNDATSSPLSRARSSSHLPRPSMNLDPAEVGGASGRHQAHRHSWALFCPPRGPSPFPSRVGLLAGGLRPSVTRLSLHNGHLLYHPLALWESPNTTAAHRCPIKATPTRRGSADNPPPDYDVAIQVSRPLTYSAIDTLQRSCTEREIQRILERNSDTASDDTSDTLRVLLLNDNETAL